MTISSEPSVAPSLGRDCCVCWIWGSHLGCNAECKFIDVLEEHKLTSSGLKSKPSKDIIAFLFLLLTLYRETVCRFEMSVNYWTMQCCIPQDNPSVHIQRVWKCEIYHSDNKIWGYCNNATSSAMKFHKLSYVVGHNYLNFSLLSIFWKKVDLWDHLAVCVISHITFWTSKPIFRKLNMHIMPLHAILTPYVTNLSHQ
jgi:hypothetical protein